MTTWTLQYEHDDALIARAVRELMFVRARTRATRLWDAAWVALAVGSAALLVLFESLPGATPAAGMRVILLLPAALLVAALLAVPLVRTVMRWWLARRMRRLPHRRVSVVLDASGVAFATAHEQYRAAWPEVKSLAQQRSFWVIRTHAGMRLVIPVEAVPPAAQAWLAARATSNGTA